MGPALLELYATPPSVKRQMSEKRDSSPKLSSPLTGRPMTRTLSMKAEILKDIDTDHKQRLPSARSIESPFSFGSLVKRSPTSSSTSLSSATTNSKTTRGSSSSSSMAKYFRLKFIGSAVLDRRYTLPMLPWIISDIRRNASASRRGFRDIELEVNDLCLKGVAPGERVPVFVHSHQFVSKLTADPKDKSCFTYLFRDHPDSQYTLYLFQAPSESIVLDLVNSMREATKALNFHNSPNLIQRSGASSLDNILSNSQQFEVMYVGKIKVYQKRAPPSFIDDAVESFRTSEQVKVKFSEKESQDSGYTTRGGGSDHHSDYEPSSPYNFPPESTTINNELGMQRPRSISSLTTCKEYKETLDEESPKDDRPNTPKSISGDIQITSQHPLIIACHHSDEKDSVFSDEGRESADDSFASRPGSSASSIGGGYGGLSGASLHLPSSSLITNTQSLDEQGRASIMRDLAVCQAQQRQSGQSPLETDESDCGNSRLSPVSPSNQTMVNRSSSPTNFLTMTPFSITISPLQETPTSTLLTTPTTTSSTSSNSAESKNIPTRKLSTEKQVSLPYRTRTNSGGSTDLRRNRQSTKFQNRTMLFLIGRLEICLISPDLQQILFNKTFNYVSHCSQGVKYMDHFGFICREPSFYPSETYVGYVFRCQTDKLVNEIMHTLKQAFHNAHHAYQFNKNKSTAICESCPMQWFHRLCVDVENLPSEKSQTIILQRLDSLPESDKNEIMSMYEGSQVSSIEEQNEIIMMLLRGMSERKQQKHCHSGKEEKRNSISTLDNLKQKARKSLSNSFETILKRTGSPSSVFQSTPRQPCKPARIVPRARSSTISLGSLSHSHCKLAQGDSTDDISSASSHSPKHLRGELSFFEETSPRPRSSTIGDVKDLQTVPEISPHMGARSESIPLHQANPVGKSPLYNIFFKIGNQKSSSSCHSEESVPRDSETGSPSIGRGYERSWRKTIFSNVRSTTTKILETPESRDQLTGRISQDDSFLDKPARRNRQELRELWKKAINQQITLIQMEKENKRLQANQTVVTCKRMKLDYEEITPCLKETCKMWEDILKKDPNDISLEYALKDGIRKGVPRGRRGEIWQFISKFNKNTNRTLNMTAKDSDSVDLDKSYRELLQQLTAQQHAILVDLGRTFPKHPFFAQPLGAGQLSLFNLLKAYSLFDTEVGYCQGLSFVAAILLLHMSEDESFEMMKYLLFHLGLRRQYKPDMSALQMQLYQLTRLLYDLHHDIYVHFETHDIPPTLYAAPWFLTLFASQFPIGFVARLFDMIFLFGIEAIFRLSIVLLATYKEAILTCSSFETIMELLKNDIPQMDVIQMERVFSQIFSLDLSRQLIVYETEYHVLQEEVSNLTAHNSISSNSSGQPELITTAAQSNSPTQSYVKQTHSEERLTHSTSTSMSPSKSSQGDLKETSDNSEVSRRLSELGNENKSLKGQNMELLDQLHVAQSNVYTLESSIETLKSTIKRLESRVRSVEEERDALFDSLNMLRQRTAPTTSASSTGNSAASSTSVSAAASPSPEVIAE